MDHDGQPLATLSGHTDAVDTEVRASMAAAS